MEKKKNVIVIIINHDYNIINTVPKNVLNIYTKSEIIIDLVRNKNIDTHGLNIMGEHGKIQEMVEKVLLQSEPDLSKMSSDIHVDLKEDYFYSVDELVSSNIGGKYSRLPKTQTVSNKRTGYIKINKRTPYRI